MAIIAEFEMIYIELSHEYTETAIYVVFGIACLIILVGSVAFSCIIKGQPVLLYIVSVIFYIFLDNWSDMAVVSILYSHRQQSVIQTCENLMFFQYGGFLACIFMMHVGVGAAAACYRDTFPKSLYDGLTRTITNEDPQKANFDFAQKHVSVT